VARRPEQKQTAVKIFITGGTGFIGLRLVEVLVKRGHEVRALVRPSSDISFLKKLGVETVEGDIRNDDAWRKRIAGSECVYHLAAGTTKDRLTKRDYEARNCHATKKLALSALAHGVRRMVYASSIGVYGTTCNRAVNEDTSPSPDSYYRETKLRGEKELVGLHRNSGLPVVVARLAHVYGPRSYSLLELCRKIRSNRFRVIGGGENYQTMVYVDDVVDGLSRCGETPDIEGTTYILTGPQPLRLREVLVTLARQLGTDIVFGTLPVLPFWLYLKFARALYRASGIQIQRAHYYDLFLTDHILTTTRAQDELSYRPQVSFNDGAARLVQWYRSEGHITD
jgi:nucleoside-diphosphate-sugar epimerase